MDTGDTDTGDTGTGDTGTGDAYCETVVGGGCLASQEGECAEQGTGEGSDTSHDEPPSLVGGGCQVGTGVSWLWVVALLVWLRRAWIVVALLGSVDALGADVEHLEHAYGPTPGVLGADIGEAWSSRFAVGFSSARHPVGLREDGRVQPVISDLTTLSLAASLNFKGYLQGGVVVPAHRLVGPDGTSGGLGQPTFFGILPVSEGESGRTAAVFHLEPPLWATPGFVGQVSTTTGVLREVSRGSWLWVGQARLRMQAAEELPGIKWGTRLEGATAVRYQPAAIGGGLTMLVSAPVMPVPLLVAEIPVEVLGFARFASPRFAVITGAGAGLTQGLGAPEFRLFATAQMRPQKRKKPEPMSNWSISIESPASLEQVWVGIDGVGGWSLSRQLKERLAPGWHELMVVAPDHRTFVARVDVPERKHRTVVVLEPLELGVLALNLIDPTGAPLAGTARVSGEDHEIPADGARLQLDAGGHELVARAPGFESLLVSVSIQYEGVTHRTLALGLAPVVVDEGEAKVRETVLFALDSANISPSGDDWLDRLAAYLIANPDIELLRVEGHADALGTSRYNLGLSQTRATAVVDGLTSRGVGAERLEAVGSGESGAPIRQVDFHVLVWDDEHHVGWEGTPIDVGAPLGGHAP